MNVQEVLNIAKERKLRNKSIVKKIVENIHKKIKYYATLKKESCQYNIPPLVDDMPLYDLENIIKDIFKILDTEGYIVTAYSNGQLDICWNEKLVNKKLNSDRFLLQQEENRLNKFNKKTKIINDRFTFLANPSKIINELSLEEKLDQRVDQLLKQKDKEQRQIARRLGNFTK